MFPPPPAAALDGPACAALARALWGGACCLESVDLSASGLAPTFASAVRAACRGAAAEGLAGTGELACRAVLRFCDEPVAIAMKRRIRNSGGPGGAHASVEMKIPPVTFKAPSLKQGHCQP